MRINTVHEFIEALRQGSYTSVGSYPIFFATSGDDGTLSPKSARENVWQIARAIRDNDTRSSWHVFACDINWEDAHMYCDHSGERIPSAYAEDETDGEQG